MGKSTHILGVPLQMVLLLFIGIYTLMLLGGCLKSDTIQHHRRPQVTIQDACCRYAPAWRHSSICCSFDARSFVVVPGRPGTKCNIWDSLAIVQRLVMARLYIHDLLRSFYLSHFIPVVAASIRVTPRAERDGFVGFTTPSR